MNPIQLLRVMLFFFISACSFCLLASCSPKITFQQSTIVPAARGTIKIKSDDNKNHVIKMKLSYLAEPERLNPPKKCYVVWLIANNNTTQNIGQIKTSHKLNVYFETVTSFKPSKIFITAEDSPGVEFPSSMIVLSTSNF